MRAARLALATLWGFVLRVGALRLGALSLSALATGCADSPTPEAGTALNSTARTEPSGGWFSEVSAAWGVDFVHDAGRTPEKHLPETMGAGVAVADVDGDADLDLYFVQSGPLPVGPAPTAARPTNRLFLNDGRGRFRDATAQSGAAAQNRYGQGVAAGDADNDGDVDFYLTNFGPDVLLLNDGHGHFVDGTAASGIFDDRWTTAATFFDADGDADQDLFVTGYVQIDVTHPLWCGEQRPGYRNYCHPDAYAGLPPRFWRNLGGGRFRDETESAGLATDPRNPGKGLGTIAFDVEPDGDLDLYAANDSVENHLWLNDGAGNFLDITLLSGTGVDVQGRTEAGMGLATGDVDGDLDIDLFVTNFDDESNTLYRNDGEGLFSDVTIAAGLEGPSRMPVGFGTVLADFDHDGDLDLAVTNGHILDNIELYHDGKTWKQRSQFFLNDGHGRFTEATQQSGALSAELMVGRALACGDLDGDGDLDLVLTENGGPARVLRNDGPPGGTLGGAVLLAGLPPGTRVLAQLDDGRQLLREAGTQTSYFAPCAAELHLGLAAAALVELSLAVPGQPAQSLAIDPPLRAGRLTLQFTAGRWTARPRRRSSRTAC
ncbi:MAG: FG-GAP repeat domain-containing protein [Planctomycetota bacterium]